MSSSASPSIVPSVPRLLGSSAPRHFPPLGLIQLSSKPVFPLAVISQVSLQPLPGLPSFRKPANSGSEGYPDSARKSPACQRMLEKSLRGAGVFRRPCRSVSARRRSGVRAPRSRRTAWRRSPWLQAALASCLSGRSQPVSGFPERQ